MLGILNQPHSAPKGETVHAIYAILFGIFIGTFLVAFEPFGIDQSSYPYRPYSVMLFGLFSTVVLVISFYALPKVLPKLYNDKTWKVWHHILLFSISILLITYLNGLYVNYLFDLSFSWERVRWMTVRTFGLGCIPAAFIILLDHNRLLQLNLAEAQTLTNSINEKPSVSTTQENTGQELKLLDNNRALTMPISDILFIESDGNYIRVYSSNSGEFTSTMLRSSISKTEAMNDTQSIIRCHRSFMVNLDKIKEVNGNAQGLRLGLIGSTIITPVSRKYIPTIRKALET